MAKGLGLLLLEGRKRIEELRQPHLNLDEDCWYSCPLAKSEWHEGSASCDETAVAKGACTCGAEAQNRLVDKLLEDLFE